MKNTIQVYGLPRSGTNFLEWSLVQYFENITYKNHYKMCDVEGITQYKKNVAVKHSFPSFEYSDKIIVIYKDFEKWSKSYEKYTGKLPSKIVWENYMNKSKKLDSDNTLIISHSELYSHYEDNLHFIEKKFSLRLKDIEIVKPKNYMNKLGANSKPIPNEIYNHE